MGRASSPTLIQRAAELDNPDALFLMASAMLGVILEDLPEDPDHRLKSAFHYQMAVAAGCTDVKDLAAQAAARLSADELEALEYNLSVWQLEIDPRDPQPIPGQCLAG